MGAYLKCLKYIGGDSVYREGLCVRPSEKISLALGSALLRLFAFIDISVLVSTEDNT